MKRNNRIDVSQELKKYMAKEYIFRDIPVIKKLSLYYIILYYYSIFRPFPQ